MINYYYFNLFVWYNKSGWKKVFTGRYRECEKRAEKYKHKTSISPDMYY